MELSDTIHDAITDLSAAGDDLAEDGQYSGAVELYERALALLPEPRTQWEAFTWLLAAIGDAHYFAGNWAEGRDALNAALHGPDAVDNPFIQLRLGQCEFELGNLPRANDALARAYMAGGRELFDDEDPQYFAHLKTVLLPPADGAW